jgi:hypothetical protein
MKRNPCIGWARWLLVLVGLFSAQAWAQVVVTVSGNQAVAQIDLLGIGADFSLTFDQPQNLSVSSLGLKANLVDPLDPALRARLPDSRLGVPLALPLMISVEPPADGGLAFSNVVQVELHTHRLPYSASSPLRLYTAHQGGKFYDITDDIRSGSVRVRGRTGDFSDFLILVDPIPLTESADDKYAFLEASVLAVPDAAVRGQLQSDLAASRSAFAAGNYATARTALDTFEARVRSNAGTAVPNRWRAARDLDNVAGDLLTEAGSLRYTLVRLGG